jgi:hypothetical protein
MACARAHTHTAEVLRSVPLADRQAATLAQFPTKILSYARASLSRLHGTSGDETSQLHDVAASFNAALALISSSSAASSSGGKRALQPHSIADERVIDALCAIVVLGKKTPKEVCVCVTIAIMCVRDHVYVRRLPSCCSSDTCDWWRVCRARTPTTCATRFALLRLLSAIRCCS